MIVRCKFACTYKDDKSGQIIFSPVYTGSEENERFFKATPSGDIRFYTVNAKSLEAFELGKQYYIDFSPAP